MAAFKKATKTQSRLRMALMGPAGSGKTYSALTIGQHLGSKIAVIDTERGSASKYADLFEFDVLELDHHSPQEYIAAIQAAAKEGYDLLIIDSLSHAWSGRGGALELVDSAAARSKSGNSFMAWRDVTPLHNQLVDAILAAPMHIVVTMRTKTEYIQERDERTGKTMPKKIGMAPIQRDGMEYEFDVVGELDLDNTLVVSKTRCSALRGAVIREPGANLASILHTWLTSGAPRGDKPQTVDEARTRFFAAFGEELGGHTWRHVLGLVDLPDLEPDTIEGWMNVGKTVRKAISERMETAA